MPLSQATQGAGGYILSYIQFAYQPEDFQEGKLETARLDLIGSCRKRELGARFRIETRNKSRLGATSRQLGRNLTPTWPPKPGQVGSPRAPNFAFQHRGGKFFDFVLKTYDFGTDSSCPMLSFSHLLCALLTKAKMWKVYQNTMFSYTFWTSAFSASGSNHLEFSMQEASK